MGLPLVGGLAGGMLLGDMMGESWVEPLQAELRPFQVGAWGWVEWGWDMEVVLEAVVAGAALEEVVEAGAVVVGCSFPTECLLGVDVGSLGKRCTILRDPTACAFLLQSWIRQSNLFAVFIRNFRGTSTGFE